MTPKNESVVGGTTPWPMPISGPSLQNPKDRLGSVPYLFAPLPHCGHVEYILFLPSTFNWLIKDR